MRPQIKPDLSALIAEYELKHGAVETTPILVRTPARGAFLETGIRNMKSRAG